VLRGLVADFCAALPAAEGEPLAAWIAESVRFPSSMVDRIVPATTDDDRAEAAKLLGLEDRGVVVTEPFRQWVVEDDFAAGRPAWEHAGVVLTADVAPYEAMKLRLLNGSHSTLAYLGALAGHAHVADAIRDDGIASVVAHLMADEVTPTLAVPDGFDVAAYQRELLDRFRNTSLRHRTVQIAMDGTQKLPQRLLGTIADRLAAGARPRLACLGVAAWMRYVWVARAEDGHPLPVDDPMADRLRELTASADTPAAVADALLSIEDVFGTALPADPAFRELVVDGLEHLSRGGVAAAVREAVAG
jgi:fructuronate reductase